METITVKFTDDSTAVIQDHEDWGIKGSYLWIRFPNSRHLYPATRIESVYVEIEDA